MKTILNYSRLTIMLVLVAFIGACRKSFLEINPKGKLIATTTSDYQLLLRNLNLVNINTDAQVPMGDEMAGVDPYFTGATLRTQRLFRWDDVIYEPGEDAIEMTVPMGNIYLYNKVINEVMNATEGTEQEKRSIRAQAMVGRAWTYFLMINYYGKPYNTTTSATDPGFPIITKADVTETQFTRASVQEVYDFIVNDLTAAIPDLPVQLTHRLAVAKTTAEGLLGKVYTFMGKFNEALPLFNAAFTDMSNAAVPVRLYDYNVTFGPGGSFLPIGLFGPAYPTFNANEEVVLLKQYLNYWAFYFNEFAVTPQTVALYGASDLRRKFYSPLPYGSGTAYPLGMMRRIGPLSAYFGVMVPDLYLLRAEVRARTNDLAGAKTDVEYLRARRMPAADAPVPAGVVSNQQALVKYILEERIREYAGTGYRWFDMRRLSVDAQYSFTVGNTHTIYSSTGAVTATYTLRPERWVLRFPQKLMSQNPAMENNQ